MARWLCGIGFVVCTAVAACGDGGHEQESLALGPPRADGSTTAAALCGGLGARDARCGECADELCCLESRRCAESTACLAFSACVGACEGDDCHRRCRAEHDDGATLYMTLSYCLNEACVEVCQ
jgi:hypothetical protein